MTRHRHRKSCSFDFFITNIAALGTGRRAWVPEHLPLSTYLIWRDWLIENGCAVWADEDCHELGWYLLVGPSAVATLQEQLGER